MFPVYPLLCMAAAAALVVLLDVIQFVSFFSNKRFKVIRVIFLNSFFNHLFFVMMRFYSIKKRKKMHAYTDTPIRYRKKLGQKISMINNTCNYIKSITFIIFLSLAMLT